MPTPRRCTCPGGELGAPTPPWRAPGSCFSLPDRQNLVATCNTEGRDLLGAARNTYGGPDFSAYPFLSLGGDAVWLLLLFQPKLHVQKDLD